MIETSRTAIDGHAELQARLTYLREVEVPQRAEKVIDEFDDGVVALFRDSRQEMIDTEALLRSLRTEGAELSPSDQIRLNDRVVISEVEAGWSEELIVHDPVLSIRTSGFISASSPLGAAVLGRRVGETAVVRAPAGQRSYLIRSATRLGR